MELALALPVMLLVALGATDLAQAYRYSIATAGAARAGVIAGITPGGVTQIGSVIRQEPSPQVNASSDWGTEGPSGANGSPAACASGSTTCGDPNGCPTPNDGSGMPSPFSTSVKACFAVRPCSVAGSGSFTCTTYGAWGTVPANGQGIQIKVVLSYQAITPLIGKFSSAGDGHYYVASLSEGLILG